MLISIYIDLKNVVHWDTHKQKERGIQSFVENAKHTKQ